MENQWLGEGFLQFRLGRAWHAFAAGLLRGRTESCWQKLAEEVRRQVLERFLAIELLPGVRQKVEDLWGQEPASVEQVWPDVQNETSPPSVPAEDIAAAWIAQAQALQAWPVLQAEAAKLHGQDICRHRWAELGQACLNAQQQLNPGSSAWHFFKSSQRDSTQQVRALLEQCQTAFVQLAGDRDSLPPASVDESLAVIEREVQRLLTEPASDWPPQRLLELHEWLKGLHPQWHSFLHRLSALSARAIWPEWSRWLGRTFPDMSLSTRARLLLIRAMVVVLDEPAPSAELLAGLEDVMRMLLASSGLEALLVHNPTQQSADWFVQVPDPAVETGQLARLGLALRVGNGAWTCFPAAELRGAVNSPAPPATETELAEAPPPPQDPLDAALAELDALASETANCVTAAQTPAIHFHLSPDLAGDLERRWLCVRQELQALEREVVPARWSFLETQLWQDLELPLPSLDAVFCNDVARSVAFRIKTFGLQSQAGETLRECTVCVSAGPLPAGFAELYALVENPSGAGEESLKQRLLRWPRSLVQGAFEAAAERLFIDFWGALGDEMRSARPQQASRFANRLSFLLEQELRWRIFHPQRYQEYPAGWLLVDSQRGAVTGDVRRVIRPGVKDADGNLRVQAKVEID